MARVAIYRGIEIRSNLNWLHEKKVGNYSVNGHVKIIMPNGIDEVFGPILERIPDNEHVDSTEEEADRVFVKYAIEYIDEMLG